LAVSNSAWLSTPFSRSLARSSSRLTRSSPTRSG
jgi:hypothetical protein